MMSIWRAELNCEYKQSDGVGAVCEFCSGRQWNGRSFRLAGAMQWRRQRCCRRRRLFVRLKEKSQWDFCGVMPVKCFVFVHMKRRQCVADAHKVAQNTPSRATTQKTDEKKKTGFWENKIATLLKCEKFFGAVRVFVHVFVVIWRCRVQDAQRHIVEASCIAFGMWHFMFGQHKSFDAVSNKF